MDFLVRFYKNAYTRRNTTALIDNGRDYTYRELFKSVRSAAMALEEAQSLLKNIGLIGVVANASFESISSLLAIQSLGSAYLPISPTSPHEYIRGIIEDAQLELLIVEDNYIDVFKEITHSYESIQIIPISKLGHFNDMITDQTVQFEELPSDINRTVYCIYTSGSTGKPKGILIKALGLSNLLSSNRALFEIQPGDRFLQFASLNFDASVYEIYTALCTGGTIVLADKGKVLPGKPLADFIINNAISIVCLPPSILKTLVSYDLKTLHTIISAGENCPVQLVNELVHEDLSFYNAYGPTETTVCASIYKVKGDEEIIPIGRPLPNTRIYLVDGNLKPVDRGEVGELIIAGDCLMKGYANTNSVVSNQLVSGVCGEENAYKTGDYAYIDLNGELVFAGRRDGLIKIRGYRVELGAIEQALEINPAIINAVVKSPEYSRSKGEKTTRLIVAYIEMQRGYAFDEDKIKMDLALRLPEYMVPQHYVRVDQMPMMANMSKIDRNALPEFRIEVQHSDSEDQLAWDIASYFDHALGFDGKFSSPISDFFSLGGDSLMVANVLSDIFQNHGVLLASELFYENPLPCQLAELVRQSTGGQTKNQTIDFHSQAEIDLKIVPSEHRKGERQTQDLLITGATGFTGAHILSELLKLNPQLKVWALIRANSNEDAKNRLITTFDGLKLDTDDLVRVSCLKADIHLPLLGLTQESYNQLSLTIDTVMHVAADISYIRPYSAIKQVNVIGTKNIIDFSIAKQSKRLHHISSLSVFGAIGKFRNESAIYESYDINLSEPFIKYENGYTISKWVAERMVKNAIEQGLSGVIYRPGFIQGHRTSGLMNTNDLFCRLLVGCIQMGSFPDYAKKYWLPVPVDYVAQSIAYISTHQDGLKYNTYHINTEHSKEATNNELFGFINNIGYPLKKLSPKEWYRTLKHVGEDNALFPLVSFLTNKVYKDERVLDIHRVTPKAMCNNTHEAIARSTIIKPEVDQELIKFYLEHLEGEGLISSPLPTI